MTASALFRARNVRYNTRVVRQPGAPDEHVRTGVKQVDATCLSCGHEWTAQAGETGLLNMLGGVRLECPRCEARGTVSHSAYE